uniref:Wall-associated receptor kinase-like 16 n=1 Tax=Ananas comosus var. bracteatus TaxID=296719 RepID=A0A6V7P1X5_ANACO|nr:unnamed protein product [Ananas comosus var. bracteatus]
MSFWTIIRWQRSPISELLCSLLGMKHILEWLFNLELLTSKKALHFEGRTKVETGLSSNFLSAMKEGRFNKLLDDQIKYDEEVERIDETATLAKACLNVKGEDRPSMKEAAEELEQA